jgi:hypothetical protein
MQVLISEMSLPYGCLVERSKVCVFSKANLFGDVRVSTLFYGMSFLLWGTLIQPGTCGVEKPVCTTARAPAKLPPACVDGWKGGGCVGGAGILYDGEGNNNHTDAKALWLWEKIRRENLLPAVPLDKRNLRPLYDAKGLCSFVRWRGQQGLCSFVRWRGQQQPH